MKTKQQIIDRIQSDYDIGDNAEQEIYAWLSDEVLKFKTPLTFLKFLEKNLEESNTSSLQHYCISNLINFIKEI